MRNILLTTFLSLSILSLSACTIPTEPERGSASVVSEGDSGPVATTDDKENGG